MKTETLIPLVQIAVAIAFVFILALREQVRSIDYVPPRGILETILLLSFVEKNLNEPVVDTWFDVPEEVAKNKSSRWYKHKESLKQYYIRYINERVLSEDELLPPADRGGHPFIISVFLILSSIVLVVITPLSALFWLGDVREKSKKYSVVRLVHPLERAMELMETIGYILMIVIWIIIITYLTHGTLRLIAMAILSLLLIIFLYAALKIVWWQAEWKKFWLNKLLHVLQHAGRKNDHDLYNRAFNLYNSVNTYPVVPLTDLQRLILFLFALIQFLLLPTAPAIIDFFQKGS